MTSADPHSLLQQAATYSRWLSTRLAADPELGEDVLAALDRPCTREEMVARLQAAAAGDEAALGRALRRLRQWVLARLIVRDLAGLADLDEVTASMTDLAELAVQEGLGLLHAELAAIHGEPLDAAGRPQRMIVVGMGKLGGRELNVSSDIDLIFVYPEDGETGDPHPQPLSPRERGEGPHPPPLSPGERGGDGPSPPAPLPRGEGGDGPSPPAPLPRGEGRVLRRIDNHEFFVRLGKRLINLLNAATADGFVFRVDMRLRPYGDSGPLAVSFGMLEQYFYTQAREWERYAWIKGRALTGERIEELEQLRHPFVFRRYLDFGAFAAMRELHAQIRREVARRDKADDIKLGPGGIREVEFIAQVFQLIRGGREPALQARPTRVILARLAEHHHLPPESAAFLSEAYVLLRNLEHRLQYLDDAQIQRLPATAEDRLKLAQAMGHADWEAFSARLGGLRRRVGEHFDQVFGAPQEDQSGHPLAGLWLQADELAIARLAGLGYGNPAAILERLRGLRGSSRYKTLPAVSQSALDTLMAPMVEVAVGFQNPDDTLIRMLDLLEAVSGRAPYLRLMQEYPQTLAQIARLVSASPWAAQYLRQRPHLLDELLDPRALYVEPDWVAARAELAERLGALMGDVERQMDELRHFKQSTGFRLLAQDLAGRLAIERLSDHLSALADLLVAATLDLVWRSLAGRHRDSPAFAVIAYGKLGGKELGYASDLDLVFLYDDDHPDAQVIYARLAKRLITWLSTHTAAGVLYDTDVRLRPDGAAGLLVSSLAAFDDYQRHQAWTWEHQALTRARHCCGDQAVGARFEAIREAVLRLPRDVAKLRADVLQMRQKMRDGHPNPSGLFDIKHDPGGLVDVEFCVQYLVLAHAHAYPDLTANIGNIALLKRCAELGLLPAAIALAAADAYRDLRRLQHAVKLQGAEHARVPAEQVCVQVGSVITLWQAVFGT